MSRLPPVMLGSYFALFVTLPFPPALILLAAFLSGRSDADFVDLIGHRDVERDQSSSLPRQMLEEYLFGANGTESRRKSDDLSEILSFVHSHNGIVTRKEIMELTGYSSQGAEDCIDELIGCFSAEPTVTDKGTVVYCFDNLTGTNLPFNPDKAINPPATGLDHASSGMKQTSGRSRWIVNTLNCANLLFALYYGSQSLGAMLSGEPVAALANQLHSGIFVLFNVIYSLAAGAHFPCVLPAIFVLLGMVPFAITVTFFALHRRAYRRDTARQRISEKRSFRKEVYQQVFSHLEAVDPREIGTESGKPGRDCDRREATRIFDKLAAEFHAEIEDSGERQYIYHFPELLDENREVEQLRKRRAHEASGHTTTETGRW